MRSFEVVTLTLMTLLTAMLQADEISVGKVSEKQAKEYKLDTDFFKKATVVQGILITTSSRVSDIAHKEAAYQFDMIMKSIKPEVAKRIRERGVLCILIGHKEFTSDIPRFKTNKKGKELDFYNWRQRGFLTHKLGRPTVVFAEEDVLEYEGGMQLESILIHEFGHVIHGAGFDKRLQDRLTEAFERARARGIWMDGRAAQRFRRVKSKQPTSLLDELIRWFPSQTPVLLKKCLDGGDITVNGRRVNSRVKVTARDKVLITFGGPKECYAHRNRAEYWAEGVQCWYNTNRTMDHDHNHIATRKGLRAYDPQLAKLCEEVLGDSEWRFVSPRSRAGKGHLKDFDPAKSPRVENPEHIKVAANDYYDKYWNDFWQRLHEKHALLPKLKSEGVAGLAKAAREQGNAIRGAVLFPQQQLGCVKCHKDPKTPIGPDLAQLDKKVSDEYLVEAILDPSKTIKKGFESVMIVTDKGKTYSGRILSQTEKQVTLSPSAFDELITIAKSDIDQMTETKTSVMPEGLVEQLAGRQDFLDLVRYMIDLRDNGQSLPRNPHEMPRSKIIPAELRGLALIDRYQCGSCHALPTPVVLERQKAPKLTWGDGLVDPAYIAAFLAKPHLTKPGSTMPDMFASLPEQERKSVASNLASYLLSLRKETFRREPVDPESAKRGNELFHSVGCVACHSPRDEQLNETLKQPSVALGNLVQKYNLKGLVSFLENPHAARPSGRMPNMSLSHWEAIDLANYLLQGTYKPISSNLPQLERDQIAEGRRHFSSMGCANCHADLEGTSPQTYPAIKTARTDRGCLSGKAGSWPQFQISLQSRAEIVAALERGSRPLRPNEKINATMATLRCFACHERDDFGGVSTERDIYFHTTNHNLGPQGRIPPTLTRVGAKLKPKWLRDVLVNGRAIRPYMKTRMPQFGAANVDELIETLQSTDEPKKILFPSFKDVREIRKAGHELVGNQGLNCVACHTFQQKPAQTMPAVDLTAMSERLNKAWFFEYMRSPQLLSRNTVMPTFWPGGRSMRKGILEGNSEMQIEAIWQYLLDGRQARTPRGLIREPIHLLAADEAVMLRRKYNGVGKRGIGVGYPGQVNLVFDAEQIRLATIWKGKFAETSGVWRSQGHGSVRPLGTDLIQFPKGPELDDAVKPWAVDDSRPPHHQFQGYDLDELRRPTLRYRFEQVLVEDYSVDRKDARSGGAMIFRTLTFKSPSERKGAAFRVAEHKQIVTETNSTFVIGGNLRIRVAGPAPARIIDKQGRKVLIVPLDIPQGTSKLTLEYKW